MKLPIRPQAGQKIPKNWFRDLYDYVAAMTTIRGDRKNIAVTQTDAGQIIRFIGKDNMSPGGSFSALSRYEGPWALSILNEKITAKRGLIWTPDRCGFVFPASCDVPEESKLILVSESGDLSAENEDSAHPDGYWNTHAILGKYDANLQKVIQYHFSPIVYMIQTEDFVIEP